MCINQFDDLTQGGKIEFSMLGSSQGRLFYMVIPIWIPRRDVQLFPG